MAQLLEDRAIIITGAGRGLGEAYAFRAASEGARLLLVDVEPQAVQSVAERIRAAGGVAVPMVTDISSWDSCRAVVDRALSEWGRLDGLVNNAAIEWLCKVGEETPEQIRRTTEVNFHGTYFMCSHAIHAMAPGGSIVNTASGAMAGRPFLGSYAATKGAVTALTYSWAAELAASGSGIRVNVITPHADTQMMQQAADFYAEARGVPEDKMAAAPATNTVAPLVTYLLSDLSSAVNGQVIGLYDGSRLSLLAHPAFVAALHRETWDEASIARAFDTELMPHQQPLGTFYFTGTVIDPPTDADIAFV